MAQYVVHFREHRRTDHQVNRALLASRKHLKAMPASLVTAWTKSMQSQTARMFQGLPFRLRSARVALIASRKNSSNSASVMPLWRISR
jgi:hypothetical protein